jgi:hypothetical protein
MKQLYKDILHSIREEETKSFINSKSVIDNAFYMVSFLHKTLASLKTNGTAENFRDVQDEITFFKIVKPEILGKMIYYNEVARLESISPNKTELLPCFYSEQLKVLNKEYKKFICGSEFYKYYKSGRTDNDHIYFRLGNINFFEGLHSFYFEIDTEFSTYYDHKVGRIISFDLLHSYINHKVGGSEQSSAICTDPPQSREFSWTDSKNALIELIYALHVAGSISNGRAGLRNLSKLFEEMFDINLGNVHHAFHQMKYRAGEKASYLAFLKTSLEQYMEKEY